MKALYCAVSLPTDWMWWCHCEDESSHCLKFGKLRYMYNKQGVCVHVEECVCMCPCMYMYDVLVEIGGSWKERQRQA